MPIVTIIRPPENTTVCRGSRVTISCGYHSVIPLRVTWIINGTSFTDDGIRRNYGYWLNNPTTPNALSLTVFSINGNTTFQCMVQSNVNTTSTLGTVTVTSGMYVHSYVCMYIVWYKCDKLLISTLKFKYVYFCIHT